MRLAQAEFFGPVDDPNKARELREGLAPTPHTGVPESGGPAGAAPANLEACLRSAKRSELAPMPWHWVTPHHAYGLPTLLGISPAYAIGTAPGLVAGYAVGLLDPACVLRRGADQWQRLVQGEPVEVGDTVATGATGRLRLQFADRDEKRNSGPSILNLAPLSEMVIEQFVIRYDDPPAATGLWRSNSRQDTSFLEGVESK